MRRAIVGLALVIGITGVACGDTGSDSVFNLGVGDCFDDEGLEGEILFEVPTVPCSEPHDNEIYYEYSMTESVYPGREATLDAADQRCLQEFEGFVGIDYFESDLDLFSIVPTQESWDDGDRTVLCALFALDLSQLTGSMRGAAR